VLIAEIVPVPLLAPFIGALADRLPRVRVMIGVGLASAVLALPLPFVDSSVVAVYAIAVRRCGVLQPGRPIGGAGDRGRT